MDTKALFKIGYGLYVVTAKSNSKDNGCINNSIMQVTSNPIQIAITMNKQNYTCSMIQDSLKLNISILDETAKFDLFKRFGFQSGKDVDKFIDFNDVKRTSNGLLCITQSTNAFLSVDVRNQIDLGTHIMFIGELVDSELFNDNKTVTYDYYQNNIKQKPSNDNKKGWRCKICGYLLEQENLPDDFVCPWCKHGAQDFERV